MGENAAAAQARSTAEASGGSGRRPHVSLSGRSVTLCPCTRTLYNNIYIDCHLCTHGLSGDSHVLRAGPDDADRVRVRDFSSSVYWYETTGT
jgi:hypothetical protein